MSKVSGSWLALALVAASSPAGALEVAVTFPEQHSATPLTGRVLLLVSTDDADEPRNRISWHVTRSMQVFGRDAEDLDREAHGSGEGDGGDTPAIAGMDEAAHVDALKGYASGEKEDASGMMADYAVALSEQDMADLAAYYATLQ